METDGLNISTNESNGSAQVLRPFDTSYLDRQMQIRQKQESDRATRSQKNVSDLSKQLQSLNKLDIFHRDQPVFQKKNAELWDFANKNIGKIRSGDTGTKLEIDKMVADLENEAQLSKADRENFERANVALATSGKAANLRPEAHDYLEKFASPENAGKYGFDPSQLKFNSNLGDWANKELIPVAKMQSEKGKVFSQPDANGIVTTVKKHNFTPAEAENLVKERITQDASMLEQASYDFSKLTDEEKQLYKDPVTFASKKLAPSLVIKDDEADIKHVGKNNEFNLSIGDGVAKNEKWTFVSEDKKNPEKPLSIMEKLTGKKPEDTGTIKSVKIKYNGKGENPAFNVKDPKHPNRTFIGIPDRIDFTKDGAKYVVIDKDTKKEVEIPEEQVPAEMKVDLGATATEIVKTGILENPVKSAKDTGAGKVKEEIVTITSQEEYDALPKGAKYKDSKGKTATKK